MIDAAGSVIENDIDGRPLPDGLKTILRKQSNKCDLGLDDERRCGASFSARSPTDNATTVT